MQKPSRGEAHHALVGMVEFGVQPAETVPKMRDSMCGRQLVKLLRFAAVIIRCAVRRYLCESLSVMTLKAFMLNPYYCISTY